jgi:hypothetical protein
MEMITIHTSGVGTRRRRAVLGHRQQATRTAASLAQSGPQSSTESISASVRSSYAISTHLRRVRMRGTAIPLPTHRTHAQGWVRGPTHRPSVTNNCPTTQADADVHASEGGGGAGAAYQCRRGFSNEIHCTCSQRMANSAFRWMPRCDNDSIL